MISTFPIATSRLVSTRLAVLAYLAGGAGTNVDIANAIGMTRANVWRVTREHEKAKLIEPIGRRGETYRITPGGKAELRRVAAEIVSLLKNS